MGRLIDLTGKGSGDLLSLEEPITKARSLYGNADVIVGQKRILCHHTCVMGELFLAVVNPEKESRN